jgi:hypothetical protein
LGDRRVSDRDRTVDLSFVNCFDAFGVGHVLNGNGGNT